MVSGYGHFTIRAEERGGEETQLGIRLNSQAWQGGTMSKIKSKK